MLSDRSPIRDDVRRLTTSIRALGLDWSELIELTALRRELYEVETRFSQLGEQGIFASLDRAGVLSHKVDGVSNVDEATRHPPDAGRAHSRGVAVQELSGSTGWSCDWSGVWNHRQDIRALDLSDPFKRLEASELDRLLGLPPVESAPRPHRTSSEVQELTSFMDFLRRRD